MTYQSFPAPATPGAPSAPCPTPARHDGWTPDRQRDFLRAVADGHTVEAACRSVGLSVASAYALRRRAAGGAFALGWQAAALVARDVLADTLLSRALDGQVDTITHANGDVVQRHRYDNRLAAAMLTRLDRAADAASPSGRAVRLVAQEFDAYLGLIEGDAAPARAGLFLAARVAADDAQAALAADLAPVVALARADRFVRTGAALAQDVDIADLDPAARADWTADQWRRAEAAGLLALAPAAAPAVDAAASGPDGGGADDEEWDADGNPQLPQLRDLDKWVEDSPLWRRNDDPDDIWITRFPPPPGFSGVENGVYGEEDYWRALTPEEDAALTAQVAAEVAEQRIIESAERDRYFALPALDPPPDCATAPVSPPSSPSSHAGNACISPDMSPPPG